MGDLKE